MEFSYLTLDTCNLCTALLFLCLGDEIGCGVVGWQLALCLPFLVALSSCSCVGTGCIVGTFFPLKPGHHHAVFIAIRESGNHTRLIGSFPKCFKISSLNPYKTHCFLSSLSWGIDALCGWTNWSMYKLHHKLYHGCFCCWSNTERNTIKVWYATTVPISPVYTCHWVTHCVTPPCVAQTTSHTNVA